MKSGPRRVVLAIADAMFESVDTAVPLGAVVDGVLGFVAAASFASRVTLRVALVVLRFAPLLLFVSLRPLDRLDVERRRQVLARVEASPLGLAFVAWRTLLVLHFYEDALALARIGYTDERRRHLAVIPAPQESGVRLREDAAHADATDDIDDIDDVDRSKGAA
jgi:hypothetical protein